MENTLSKTAVKSDPEVLQAKDLHERIIESGARAADAYCEMCRNLKLMRDEKYFFHLGYSSFEEYTVKALGFKSRQAYTYIQQYENLGEPFLKSNAELGVTKLSLLVNIPVLEREEFVEEHDIAGMSVAEVKRLVEENDRKGEQLSLLETEVSQKNEEISARSDDLTAAYKKIEELTAELEKKQKPVVVTASEPDTDAIEKIRTEEKKKYDKKYQKERQAHLEELKKIDTEHEQQIEKAKKEAAAAAERESKTKISALESEKQEMQKRLEVLEKEQAGKNKAISAADETSRFKVYFEELQKTYNALTDSLEKIKAENAETGAKYHIAVKKFLGIMIDKLEE